MDLTQLSDEELDRSIAELSAQGQPPPAAVSPSLAGTTGRSARNNNPWNLEYAGQEGATVEPEGRFAQFPSMEHGYQAGIRQIQLDAGRGHTLASFVHKFSPPHQNPTAQLIRDYSQALGVDPNTPLSQIDPHALAVPMLGRESSTRVKERSGDALTRRMEATSASISKPDLSSLSNEELDAMIAAESAKAGGGGGSLFVAPVTGEVGGGHGDPRDGGKRQHKGTDFYAPAGAPHVAPVDLEFIQGGTGGTNLRPNDKWAHFKVPGTDYEYHIAHQGELPEPGAVFKQGQPIGTVGNVVDKPHIHAAFYNTKTGEYEDVPGQLGLKRGMKVEAGKGLGPTEEPSFAKAWGLPEEPPTPSVADRLLGGLSLGVSKAVGRYGRLSEAVFGPGAPGVAAVHGFEVPEVSHEEYTKALTEAEDLLKTDRARKVEESPATSWPGWAAEGLIQMIPELPLFSAAGRIAETGLGGAALLPKVGPQIAKAIEYMSPEAIKAASVLGAVPRIAAHGAVLGGTLGLTTGHEGERLKEAGEEAAGFALAAPVFHVAGKAIVGLTKGLVKGVAKVPINFSTLEDAQGRYDVQQFETRSAAAASVGEGQKVGRVAGKWSVLTPKAGVEVPVADVSSDVVQAPIYKDIDEVLKSTEELPSGVPTTPIETKDGKVAKVGDYSRAAMSSEEYWRGKEIGEEVTPGDIKKMARAAGVSAETGLSLPEELKLVEPTPEGKVLGGAVPGRTIAPAEVPKVEAPVVPDIKVETKPSGKLKVTKADFDPEDLAHQARAESEFEDTWKELHGDTPQSRKEIAFAKSIFRALSKSDKIEADRFWRDVSFQTNEEARLAFLAQDLGATARARSFYSTDTGKFLNSIIEFYSYPEPDIVHKGGISDVPHEIMHYWMKLLTDDAKVSLGKALNLPAPVTDVELRNSVLGENMAKGFEKFWHSGRLTQADREALGIPKEVLTIWKQFKEWMAATYYYLKGYGQTGLDIPLDPKIENFFRESLGLKPAVEPVGVKKAMEIKPAKEKVLTAKQLERKMESLANKMDKLDTEAPDYREKFDQLTAQMTDYKAKWNERIAAGDSVFNVFSEKGEYNDPRDVDQLGFYSKMRVELQGKLPGGTMKVVDAEGIIRTFMNKGYFKKAEAEDSGLFDWLADLKERKGADFRITKDDVLDYVRKGGVQIDEVQFGLKDVKEGEAWIPSPYEHTQRVPGPYQNFRDFRFTLPIEPPYEEPHGLGQNVFAHMFVSDRDIEGKKILLVEQLQSQLHQVGQAEGYFKPTKEEIAAFEEAQRQYEVDLADWDKKKQDARTAIPLIKAEMAKHNEVLKKYSGLRNSDPETTRLADLLNQATYKLNTAREQAGYPGDWEWTPEVRDAQNAVYDAEKAFEDRRYKLFQKQYKEIPEFREAHKNYYKLEDELTYAREAFDTAPPDRPKMEGSNLPPDVPFKKNWYEVALKRAVRYASENGYDGVAIANGDTIAKTNTLRQVVDKLEVSRSEDGTQYTYRGYKNGNLVKQDTVSKKELEATIGPEKVAKVDAHQGSEEAKQRLGQIITNWNEAKAKVDAARAELRPAEDAYNEATKGLSVREAKEVPGIKELEEAFYKAREKMDDALSYEHLARKQVKEGVTTTLADEDLDLGAKWPYQYYDQKFPQALNEITKRWGGRVEESAIKKEGVIHRDVSSQGITYSTIDGEVLKRFNFNQYASPEEFDAAEAKWIAEYKAANYDPVHLLNIDPKTRGGVMEGLSLYNKTEAKDAYDESGQTEKFHANSDALLDWSLKSKQPDPEVALNSAANKGAAKPSAALSEEVVRAMAKQKGIDEKVSDPFIEQVKRAWKSDLYMRDITRAWSYGVEEVTKVINRNDLFRLGEALGMKEEIKAAKEQKREFDILRSIFDRVASLIDVSKSPNITNLSKDDLIKLSDVMRDANDSVAEWRRLFIESRPNMLKEDPGEKVMRQVGTWIEDRLGYSPKALEKVTHAAYRMTVNMQHAARRWPVLKPLFELGQARQATATEYRKALLFGDREKGVPGINSYYELVGTRPDLTKTVDKILLQFDSKPDLPGLTRDAVRDLPILSKLSDGDKTLIAETIGDIRETLDYSYYKLRNDFESNLDPKLSPEIRAVRMKQWDKEHNYHPNYFPHIREGDIVVQVMDHAGNVVYSTRTDSGFEAKKIKTELQKKYPKMRVGDFSTQVPSTAGVSGAALRQFVSRIETKAAQAGQEVGNFAKIADRLIKEYGLRGHYIARESPEGIPGFEENVGKALYSYADMFAGHMGKMEFLRGAFDEVAGLKGYGKVQNFARDWVDLTLRPSNKVDDVIATAKNAAFLKYIGGVLKTGVVTTFDKITNAYPMFAMYVDNPKQLLLNGYRDGAKFWSWEGKVGKVVEAAKAEARAKGVAFNELDALQKARTEVELPKGLTQEEVDGLLALRKTGQLDAVFTHVILEHHKDRFELMSQAQRDFVSSTESYLKRGWDKTLEWGGKLIGTMESYGRTTTALSALRMFRQLGYSAEEAAVAGGRFMLDAHGYYGKMNLPLWMMKDVGKFAKLPFTFRVFEHHYINLIGNMLLGQQGKAGRVAAAKSLGLLAGLGGMMSLPFFTTASKLFREATGTDPEVYVRKQLNNIDPSQTMADLFSYGVPAGTIGLDLPAISLRSSTEMGRIDTGELLLGAPGQAIADVAKGTNAALEGDWDGFFDAAMPSVLKNPKRALERYYYGAVGPSGKKLTEGVGGEQIKYGVGEAIGQAFGFTPSKIEKYYQATEAAIADREYWGNKRKVLYARLQKAINKGDEASIARVFDDIQAYNEKAIDVGPDVTLITSQEIKQSIQDRLNKKKFLQAERLGLR